MRNLGLGDLLLVLRNLATDRKTDLLLSSTGKLYAKKLAKQQEIIEALPEALRGGRPLAQQLGEKDELHDGFGQAIYFYTEAVLQLPTAPAALKETAQRIRNAFVPRLSILRASYADEAAAAVKKRSFLDSLKADLNSFPIPFPQGATLRDWATAFVDAGDDLDKLLDDRAVANHAPLPPHAATVRSNTIGLLSRFRAALLDEIDEDQNLPRDLEARVFGYLDELQAMREQAAAGRAKASKGTAEPSAEAPNTNEGGP